VTHRAYLDSLEFHGIKLGLDNIRRLLHAVDNPQDRLFVIHIAGTNGKGSVVALLDAMLRAGGYRTARFTSPHLIEINERFVVDGVPVADVDLDAVLGYLRPRCEAMVPPPTYFELCTAVAFQYFAVAEVDVALIEVGMGGRFDSTNVVEPLATAITNIDLEHTAYLGDTLEKIAFEKAGIIKPGVPVVVGETRPGPREVILTRAEELGSPVVTIEGDFHYALKGSPFAQLVTYEGMHHTLNDVPLSLAGPHQGANAAVAVALAEVLAGRYPKLTLDAIITGLCEARWPCRMERVADDPPVIIDVAHNVAGAKRLADALDAYVLVLAVASDKDAGEMLRALAPKAKRIILTAFEGHRALSVEELSAHAAYLAHDTIMTLPEAIEQGLAAAHATLPLVITGSVFTAGQARAHLMEGHGAPALSF
jgi:dihydrofolate synthase/folylpolyglutamate synthase